MDSPLTAESKAVVGGNGWPVYSLYGLSLASDFPFASYLGEGAGTSDLTFRITEAPPTTGLTRRPADYVSPLRLDNGSSFLYVYRQDGYLVLRFTEVADFYLWPDSIVCHLLDPDYDYMVEIYLLGVVFSIWMELRGIPALHASAAVVEDRAAAFLATNSGGKSSLAATLMQAGHPLLTDDVLPLERPGETLFLGRPGYPQMRMWPDQARRFLGCYENLEIVHPAYSKRRVPVGEDGLGTLRDEPVPLACFYLPERRDSIEAGTGIEIVPVSRAEALMSLIGQSFVPRTVEALGLQKQRLGFFASLVGKVPVRRLIYPNGFDHLPNVRRAILDDLAALPFTESEDG